MRAALLSSLLALAACQAEESLDQPVRETFRSGRDALCIVRIGEAVRAGLITYGAGDVNCSVGGTATETNGELSIVPRGDAQCRIPVRLEGRAAIIGDRSDGCAYYCGPGADYSGRRLHAVEDEGPVTDLAGDPLC